MNRQETEADAGTSPITSLSHKSQLEHYKLQLLLTKSYAAPEPDILFHLPSFSICHLHVRHQLLTVDYSHEVHHTVNFPAKPFFKEY